MKSEGPNRKFRFLSVIIVLGLAGLAVIGRFAWISVAGDSAVAATTAARRPESFARGSIVDRGGKVLALDTPMVNIAVWKPSSDREDFFAQSEVLSSILKMRDEDIRSRWDSSASDFFYLARRQSPEIASAIQQEQAAGKLGMIVLENIDGRTYPEQFLASHLIGFVGDGNQGLSGIEHDYNAELMGELTAAQSAAAQSAARVRQPASASAAAYTKDRGYSVQLSIDANLQFLLEKIATNTLRSAGAQAVILLASDAKTGEILSYIAKPDFDPNNFAAYPSSDWYNWPALYAYEPGSVFKVFSMASVLDLGGVNTNTEFYCDGAYHALTPNNEPITIKCLGVHGIVTLKSILEFSCNSGAAYASDSASRPDFYNKLQSFGFGARTGIDLDGETAGQFNDPVSWSFRTKPTIAIGQEILVSALQMISAASALANEGMLLKPILVRRIMDSAGNTVVDNPPVALRRVLSASSAREIVAAMESASSESGTGWRGKVKDVRMALKTGTAQMIDVRTKAYSDKDFIASTIAILPVDNPRLILYLAIIKPTSGEIFGGRIAAPVVKEAAEAALSILDIPRDDSPSYAHTGRIEVPPYTAVQIGEIMPDLTGTPKRLLAPLLLRADITVLLHGDGYVVAQNPAAGTAIQKGSTIVLELK